MSLNDPVTVVPCFDDVTAASFVKFIPTVLDKASRGSLADLKALPELIKNFVETIPESVSTCLAPENNAEITSLLAAFGNPQNDPKLMVKIINFVTLHYSHVHDALKIVDGDWNARDYISAGSDFASLAKEAIAHKTSDVITA